MAEPAVPLTPISLRHAEDRLAPFDGRYQLVSDGERFSVARWDGEAFVYSSGARVSFAPSHFQAPARFQAPAGERCDG